MLLGYITKNYFWISNSNDYIYNNNFCSNVNFDSFPYVNIIFLYLVKYLVINKENNLELEKRKKNIFTRDSLFNINKVNLSIIYFFNSNLF